MKLQAYDTVLTSPAEDFGPMLCRIFLDWRQAPDFSCTALADVGIDHIGMPDNKKIYEAAIAALKLADEQSGHAYHSHHHNREVAAMTLALLVRHRAFNLLPKISNDMAWLTLAAAAIHDYKHDGTGNKADPMRLEKSALDAARPHLMQAGLSNYEWLKLSMIVLPTDILPTDRPSPSAQLKQIYNHNSGFAADIQNIDPLFLSLLYDHELAACGEILSDADLGVSAALDVPITQENSKALDAETKGRVSFTPQSLNYYLTHVCQGFPGSLAGKIILSPGYNRLRRKAQNDVDVGISYGME